MRLYLPNNISKLPCRHIILQNQTENRTWKNLNHTACFATLRIFVVGVISVCMGERVCVRTPCHPLYTGSRPRPCDAHTADLESDGSASRKRAVTSKTVRSFRTESDT